MGRTVNPISPKANTVVQNSGGISIIEVVERGPQGPAGNEVLAAVSEWKSDSEYTLNQKVSYLASIYNAIVDTVPAGTLPTDENFWEDITGSGESVIPVRGGDVPVEYDPTQDYLANDRVSYQNREYRCTGDTPTPSGTFDPLLWDEVSTQSNEARIAALEAGSQGSVINE